MATSLEVFVPDELWLRGYVVSVGGARINARMTVIKLRSGDLLIHSPCAFDEALTAEVAALGPVAAIIAPGNFHWLHVRSCQQAFPQAVTYICPGVEKRAKGLTFDEVLGDEAPALWAGELSQVYLQGTRVMREVAFFHHASKTLILVDMVENVTAATPGTNWFLRILFRMIGMWNTPPRRPSTGLARVTRRWCPPVHDAYPRVGLRARDPLPRRPHHPRCQAAHRRASAGDPGPRLSLDAAYTVCKDFPSESSCVD